MHYFRGVGYTYYNTLLYIFIFIGFKIFIISFNSLSLIKPVDMKVGLFIFATFSTNCGKTDVCADAIL